jgi:hypothetical protein
MRLCRDPDRQGSGGGRPAMVGKIGCWFGHGRRACMGCPYRRMSPEKREAARLRDLRGVA